MTRRWIGAGLAAAFLTLGAAPAGAHPHVWIDARNAVVFDEKGRVVAVDVEWTFDEFYTTFAIDGLDADGDGTVEREELTALAEQNVLSLAEYRYFTQIELGTEPVSYAPVTEYHSELAEDGRLMLAFRLPLEKAVDPRADPLTVVTFDPTLYIAIDLVEQDPVTMAGAGGAGCGARLVAGKDAADTFSFSESLFQQVDVAQQLSRELATTVWVECR